MERSTIATAAAGSPARAPRIGPCASRSSMPVVLESAAGCAFLPRGFACFCGAFGALLFGFDAAGHGGGGGAHCAAKVTAPAATSSPCCRALSCSVQLTQIAPYCFVYQLRNASEKSLACYLSWTGGCRWLIVLSVPMITIYKLQLLTKLLFEFTKQL